MGFDEAVWELCRKVPKGRVTTYKELAKAMGTKAFRAVGSALKRNPYAPEVPCHRVVCSDGSIGGFRGRKDSKDKQKLLAAEGIIIESGKIKDFEKKLFLL